MATRRLVASVTLLLGHDGSFSTKSRCLVVALILETHIPSIGLVPFFSSFFSFELGDGASPTFFMTAGFPNLATLIYKTRPRGSRGLTPLWGSRDIFLFSFSLLL